MVTRRIILVLDDCGAGDALRLSFCVESVRRAHPTARITMIAGEGAAGIYRDSPFVDRLVESRLYKKHRPLWRGRLTKATELGRLVFAAGLRNDLVIVFWWGSRTLAALARIAGRGTSIGYAEGSRLLSRSLGKFDYEGDEVVQNVRLLQAAGITERAAAAPSMTIPERTGADAEAILRDTGWDGRSPIVVIHAGSDWACQQWIPERWAAVADRMAGSGAQVVFTGTAPERGYIEHIRGSMVGRSASIAGMTTVGQLAAIVRRASLVVTVDSAAYVVARSQRVPSVVLTGPSHPERLGSSAPAEIVKRMTEGRAHQINECKQPRYPAGGCLDYSCPLAGLRELSVDDVLGAIDRVAGSALQPIAI